MSDKFDALSEDNLRRWRDAAPSEDDLRRWHDEVKSWLEKRLSLAEVEAENMVEGRPFDFQSEIWETLKGRRIVGLLPGLSDSLCARALPGDH